MPFLIERESAQHRTYRLVGFGLLALVAVAVMVLLPEFQVRRTNRMLATAVAILGLNLVVGFSGLLALCQSAFIAIGAFITATLVVDHGWDYWMTIPAAMLGAFIVGVILGIPALKIKGLYLAMSTVAFASAFPALAKLELHLPPSWLPGDFWKGDLSIAHRTGGANGRELAEVGGLGENLEPTWFPWFAEAPDRYRFVWVALLAALAFWLVGNLVKSRPGRAVVSIRDNEIGAAVSGVNLPYFKVLNFGLSAALGGLAGVMWAMSTGFVAEQDFLFVLMVDLLVGLVIGGVGTVSGALVGAIVVVFGRWLAQTYFDYSISSMIWLALVTAGAIALARKQTKMLNKILAFLGVFVVGNLVGLGLFAAVDVPGLYQLNGDGPLSQAIFGIILIVVVFFAPQGIIGAWRRVWSHVVRVTPVAPELSADAESISAHFDPELI